MCAKTTIKRVVLAVVVLAVVQVGVLSHYMVQTNQVTDQGAELEGLKEELSQSRGQAVGFSEAIDNMQQRVLTIQTLNEKLQVMFGLEPEKAEETGRRGPRRRRSAAMRLVHRGSVISNLSPRMSMASSPGNPGARMAADIKKRLFWLERQTARQLHKLGPVGKSSGENGSACGPRPRPSGPSKAPCPQGSDHAFHPLPAKGHSMRAWISVAHEGKPCEPLPKAKVVEAAYDWKIGNFIRINHRYGVETTYGHLSKLLVRDGQEVKRGDVLGLIGSTGPILNRPAPPLPDSRKRQSRRSPPIYTRLASPPFPAVNPAYSCCQSRFSFCHPRLFPLCHPRH